MIALPTLALASVAALVVTLVLRLAVRSRFIKGRLLFTAWLLVAGVALEFAVTRAVGDVELLSALSRLVFVLAVVNLVVAVLVNTWRDDRPSEHIPAIVQDFTIITLFVVISTVLMREQLLTTSAIGAVVVGFALQDTLGNLFAGLAIQIEKPFRVGHWVKTGDYEGRVQEVTWRATKLLTKAGQFLVVPNSVISKDPVLNYSEPTQPTRVEVEVGASYLTPPNEVKRALGEAVANAPLAMPTPAPQFILSEFGSSSMTYRVLFWIEDYATDSQARDQVRTNIWYSFRRANIEIPWPIQVEYSREEQPVRTEAHVQDAIEQLGKVDLFSILPDQTRAELARAARDHLFAAGEAIVRQEEPGSSMFVVLDGRVRVALEPSDQEVSVIEKGGFFGEMSMLTGDPRTATVRALTDVRVIEVSAADMRRLALANAGLIEQISAIVSHRREGLAEAHATAAAAAATAGHAPQGLLARIRRFLRLDGS